MEEKYAKDGGDKEGRNAQRKEENKILNIIAENLGTREKNKPYSQ